MRWRGPTGFSAISRGKESGKTLRGAFALTNFDQRAHEAADHLFQKPVGIGFDAEFVALANYDEALEVADRVLVFGRLRLE